jgi:RHS repeat-associated protein
MVYEMRNQSALFRLTVISFKFICVVGLLTFLSSINVSGQSTTKSATDGWTPPGLTPGSPMGTYPLSDFDNVNLFNGGLNFHLPLHKVEGRGGAQMLMTLAIEQKWRTLSTTSFNGVTVFAPEHNWWTGLKPGYGPGIVQGRTTSIDTQECGVNGPLTSAWALSRITFTAPDGTEYELRDTLTNGQPIAVSPCATQGASRGRNFVSADGTSMTFVSDAIINDNPAALGESNSVFYPTGYLLMQNGTRYRVESGLVVWLRDSNGNQLSFTYDNNGAPHKRLNRVIAVTDSLNRQVTINYDAQDVAPYGLCDQIIFNGFGGVPRVIRVSKSPLGSVLRSGYTLKTQAQLFPELDAACGTLCGVVNPTVVSAMWLPDGRAYKFYYNSYIELARVELPTGGAFEYDYDAGVVGAPLSGVAGGQNQIYRRLVQKRLYKENSILENKTTYSRPESATSPNVGYVKVEKFDSNNASLSAQLHYFHGSAFDSFNGSPYQIYPRNKDGREYQVDLLDSNGSTLQRTTYEWQQRASVSWWSAWASSQNISPNNPAETEPPNDLRISQIVTTLVDTNQVASQSFSYDSDVAYNLQTEVREYDYGTGSTGALLRRTVNEYLKTEGYTGNSVHIRALPLRQSIYDVNNIERARITYEYDNYASDTNNKHAALINYSDISGLCTWVDSSNQCVNTSPSDASDPSGYKTRGNLTGVSRWLLSNAGAPVGDPITSYMQYDVAGNMVKVIDPLDHQTVFDYTDRFGAPEDNDARENTVPLELNSKKSYAYLTKPTNALGQSTYAQYDYYQGKVVNAEDLNGGVSNSYYSDALGRLSKVVAAANNIDRKSQTSISYDDTNRMVIVTGDLTSYNDNLLKSETLYDGLGRTIESRVYESTSYIVMKRKYDAMGRVFQVSNPYRPSDGSPVWTETAYDALGRVKTITTPDGSQAVSTYEGTTVIVRDQAGKQWRSTINSLGQLKKLEELNEYPATSVYATTNYLYDALGNLTKVLQENQTREFIFNSLGQLKSSMNPESGTVTYDYYNDGKLWKVTDARAITTQLEYDVIHRVKTKTYLNDPSNTPAVNYYYDAQILPPLPAGAPAYNRGASLGQLTAVTYGGANSNSGTYFGYDAAGMATQSIQVTDGKAYGMGYDYNRAGGMKSQTYPSGRTILTEYDTTGRISTITGQKAGESNRTYVSSPKYAAHGAVKEMKLGDGANSLWEHTVFNNRLQPVEIGLGSSSTDSSKLKLEYNYGSTNNNGNVQRQIITVPGTTALTLTQIYKYDQSNRLTGAQEVSGNVSTWQTSSYIWQQGYDYDKYGNRNSVSSVITGNSAAFPTFTPAPEIDGATNQFKKGNSSGVSTGFDYDPVGNLKQEPYALNRSVLMNYAYDANNHLVQAKQNGSVVGSYVYDGAGKRVKKVDSATTIFVYNILGQIVAEYSDVTPSGASGTSYLIADNLGSPRAITNSSGEVIARHDYLPFGEEIGAGIGGRSTVQKYMVDQVRQKFTGYERDDETGLDFAQARYYGNVHGRFTSVDPLNASASSSNPQTFNRYSYTLNNPLRYADPSGMLTQGSDQDEYEKKKQEEEERAREKYALEIDKRAPSERGDVINVGRKPGWVPLPASLDPWALKAMFDLYRSAEELAKQDILIDGLQFSGSAVGLGGTITISRNGAVLIGYDTNVIETAKNTWVDLPKALFKGSVPKVFSWSVTGLKILKPGRLTPDQRTRILAGDNFTIGGGVGLTGTLQINDDGTKVVGVGTGTGIILGAGKSKEIFTLPVQFGDFKAW